MWIEPEPEPVGSAYSRRLHQRVSCLSDTFVSLSSLVSMLPSSLFFSANVSNPKREEDKKKRVVQATGQQHDWV